MLPIENDTAIRTDLDVGIGNLGIDVCQICRDIAEHESTMMKSATSTSGYLQPGKLGNVSLLCQATHLRTQHRNCTQHRKYNLGQQIHHESHDQM